MRQGFTLVEAILAVSLSVILISAALGPFINIRQFEASSRIRVDIEQNIQYFFNILNKELYTGSSAVLHNDGRELEFQDQDDNNIRYKFIDHNNQKNQLFKFVNGKLDLDYGDTQQFEIRDVKFFVQESTDEEVARVTISILAEPTVGREDSVNNYYMQSTTIMRN